MKKRALIFGASGQDGGYLSKLLLSKGYEVSGTSRDADLSAFSNLVKLGIKDEVKTISANPCDFRSVLDAIDKSQPNEIYNLAGQSSVGLSFEQPCETFLSIGMANLTILEAIRFSKMPIRYYNAGSGECFGETETPANEQTMFRPKSPYAVAKASAFWQVANYREAYGLFACSGILFNHESILRPPRFVTRKIVSSACRIAAGENKKLELGNLDVSRDFGYAPEYVEAMWKMLQTESPDDYVVATGKSISLMNFVEKVFLELGLDWTKHVILSDKFTRPSDIKQSLANPDKARRILGWEAKTKIDELVHLLVISEQNGGL